MPTIDHTLAIATAAHAGQTDKAGAPYVTHCVRLAEALESPEERIVALLHDVLEKGPGWTAVRLGAEGFPSRIVAAVAALTRRDGEDHEHLVRRAAGDRLARRVKIADLKDNIERTLAGPEAPDRDERLARYRRGLAILGDA